MKKISVVISAYNESKKIKDCLRSVSFADEIIVIDNSSTDGTGTIASSFGARVYKRPNNLMLNINKNYGFTKAKNEWVLSLDADERVTEELRAEISNILATDQTDVVAYEIPRKNIIFGKWIEHTGWYPDYQLRLFQNGKGKFPEKHVHEMLSVKGIAGKLSSPMLHESYATIREFLMKFFVIYAPNEAENVLKEEKYSFSPADFLTRPVDEFVTRFYFHKGYKDGIHGLVLSLLMAFYHFVVVCFIWEKQKFVNTSTDSRDILDKELKHLKKDMKYWKISSRINESKNPIYKSYQRLLRKL